MHAFEKYKTPCWQWFPRGPRTQYPHTESASDISQTMSSAHQFDAKLAREIKKYPCIYNPTLRSATAKRAAWMAVSKSLKVPIPEAKTRWKNLRDKFVREKKRLVLVGESAYDKKEPWPLLENMAFLWEHTSHKLEVTIDNMEESSEHSDEQKETNNESSWIELSAANGDSSVGSAKCVLIKKEESITSEDTQNIQRNPIHDDAETDSLISAMRMRHSSLVSDEEELFCMSVAATLRRFSQRQKAMAKLRIQQILFELDLHTDSTVLLNTEEQPIFYDS